MIAASPQQSARRREAEARRFRRVIPAAEIDRLVRGLARRIDAYYAARSVSGIVIVCVMNASFMFCADLVRRLKTPARIVFTRVRSYQGIRKGRTAVAPITEDLRGKHVLIVDTIFDTGKTIEQVVREVRKQATNVQAAVLVVKPRKSTGARRRDIRFQGAKLPGDPFLVGYGLDIAGKYRGLKDICEIV